MSARAARADRGAACCAAWLGRCAGADRRLRAMRRRARYDGGWVGAAVRARPPVAQRHAGATKSGGLPEVAVVRQRRRASSSAPASPASPRRARCMQAGVDDVHVLELEDGAGGNSRGHAMAGMRCPLGAHYLPVPGEQAVEVIELLEELGLRKTVHGRAAYDERTLCHSPQERLFIHGGWRDGLLPPIEALPRSRARASRSPHYRAFAAAVAEVSRDGAFAIPTARSRWTPALAALDARHLRRLARRAAASSRPPCAGTSTTAAATTTAPAARRSRPGPACTTSPAGTAFARPAPMMRATRATAC